MTDYKTPAQVRTILAVDNLPNLAAADFPVSTEVQTALDAKATALDFKQLIVDGIGAFPVDPVGFYAPFAGVVSNGGLVNQSSANSFPANVFHGANGQIKDPVSLYRLSGATLTYNYGDGPVTGQRTLRVQSVSGIGRLFLNTPLLAGDYILCMEAKAASAVAVGFGVPGDIDTINVTTSFQTFSKTVTYAGGTLQPVLLNKISADYDIEVANIRMFSGSVDLGVDVESSALLFGRSAETAENPTSYNPPQHNSDGIIPLGGVETISGATIVLALNDGGDPTILGQRAMVTANDQTQAGFGTAGDSLFGYANGSLKQGYESRQATDAGWSVVAYRIGSGGVSIYRNGLPVYADATALTPFDAAFWSVSTNTGRLLGPIAIWHTSLHPDEVIEVSNMFAAHMAASGLPAAYRKTAYYPCGDSITFGANSGGSVVDDSYAEQIFEDDTKMFGKMIAVGGDTLDAQIADIALYLPEWRAASNGGLIPIVSLMIGRNDSTELVADPAAYYERVKAELIKITATGAIAIGCDILPGSGAGYNTARAAFNARMATDAGVYFSAHCDFSGVASGQDGAELNSALYADGIHPTQAAHDELHPVFLGVFNGVRGRT